jgi:hypothetical protein
MVEKIKTSLESFEANYGTLIKWALRAVFYPVLLLLAYSATAYLNVNYVKQGEFAEYKAAANADTKQNFKEVNKKLDLLLLRDASGGEKFSDFERRITRLENKADKN